MKAALYIRVSTDDQDMANQRLALERLCDHRGWDVVYVYEEAESAWKAGHQRELARALRDAQRGRFRVLVIWALDRLSREGPRAMLEVVHRFLRAGCRILSAQEPWTETPNNELSELLYSVVAWVAQFESKRLSERTKAGLERARARGKRLGRPPGVRDRKPRKKGPPGFRI